MRNIIPEIKSVKLRTVEYNCSHITGYKIVGVNPEAFLAAIPIVVTFPMENPHPKTPPEKRIIRKELVHLKFCQGQGWDEYDVEPEEAFRILGYDVRLED